MIRNLNEMRIETDGKSIEQSDYSMKEYRDAYSVSVFFKNLEAELIENISKAKLVVGCVAWLTSVPILEALSKTNCSIIVQKEDFLRPDLKTNDYFAAKLRLAYSKLHCNFERYEMHGLISDLNVCSDPSIDPVRCVGNINRDKNATLPRSHHKFVVFCDALGEPPYRTIPKELPIYEVIAPYAVWTGSYNFTKNSGESFENAVLIKDLSIAQAYFNEYSQIFALSEPLDWKTEWVSPTYRIGT